MARDIVYQYKSENNYKKEELGEIQSDFNMSFVIDGTKDSWKVQVFSYIDTKIKPMTIIKHQKTNTWWVVKHDKIEKYYNEQGFLYVHNLQIQGAFEWLNSIDMTDHGYSNNRYTLRSALFRLFRMAALSKEWSVKVNNQLPTDTDLTEIVDYIKTFENYTLMSAIREFLDGYNMVGKLTFVEVEENNETYIKGLNLNTILKTGSEPVNESVFNEVKEITTMDDNSYGTSVVSNAENVVSTQAKTYPTVGVKRLDSQAYQITPDNAIFRLPSPAFKVNYVKIRKPSANLITRLGSVGTEMSYAMSAGSKSAFHKSMQQIAEFYRNTMEGAYDIIMSYENYLFDVIQKSCTITLYNVNQYDPQTTGFIAPKDNPDFHMVEIHAHANSITPSYRYEGNLWLTDNETYNQIDNKYKAVYWTKGSDIIGGFGWIGNISNNREYTYIIGYASTDLLTNDYENKNPFLAIDLRGGSSIDRILYFMLVPTSGTSWRIDQLSGIIVNYVPMNDLKIKYDNTAKGNETLLYNQNGKLTDSVALSKLMDSYSKEVEHPNITRSGIYYDFNSVPKVGNTCIISGVRYVINNVSLDFERNENDSYVIYGEFTMSANVATKSLMTNADTNIRDYGIPQKDNVKRKQLYRDYYEIGYTSDIESDNDYYLGLDKCLNIGHFPVSQTEYTAVIKVEWYEQEENESHEIVDVNKSWYYQLDTINYSMQKALYKVVDFKDNNIIGYDAQNVASAFQVSRIFTGMTDTINTPISYVKNTGGQEDGTIRDIHIAMCNEKQLSEIYEFYQTYVNGGAYASDTTRNLINWSVFIDSKIYEGGDLGNGHTLVGAKDNCDFMISEINYDKDAVEVPVFEYSCQIDDSEDVEIGDNIFDNKTDDIVYMYCFTTGARGGSPILKPNLASVGVNVRPNVNDNLIDIMNPYHNSYELKNSAIKLEFVDNDKLKITGYGIRGGVVTQPAFRYSSNGKISYDENNVIDFSDPYEFDDNLHIIRIAINKNTKMWSQNGDRYVSEATITDMKVDKMFTIKNVRSCEFDNGSIILHLNHYKLN